MRYVQYSRWWTEQNSYWMVQYLVFCYWAITKLTYRARDKTFLCRNWKHQLSHLNLFCGKNFWIYENSLFEAIYPLHVTPLRTKYLTNNIVQYNKFMQILVDSLKSWQLKQSGLIKGKTNWVSMKEFINPNKIKFPKKKMFKAICLKPNKLVFLEKTTPWIGCTLSLFFHVWTNFLCSIFTSLFCFWFPKEHFHSSTPNSSGHSRPPTNASPLLWTVKVTFLIRCYSLRLFLLS